MRLVMWVAYLWTGLTTFPLTATNPVSSASQVPGLDCFDYVIVGAGPCGLVLANRLSENASVTVALIEAGGNEDSNVNVTDPAAYTKAFDTDIDWGYRTVPRAYRGKSRQLEIHAGKGLGGSTLINGMAYLRAQSVQIDAWETIGNKGWNWANLWPYYLKHETFQVPTPAQAAAGATHNPAFHGMSGPVAVGWEYNLINGSTVEVNNQTWQDFGYDWNSDPNGGNLDGFTVFPRMVNRTSNTRADAASSYLYPVQQYRPNLYIYQGLARRLIWATNGTSSCSLATAAGVEFTASNGATQMLTARREVILSAGALRSPAILEHSGIGNPSVLNQYNITTVVINTAVGEHLQDQPTSAMGYSSLNTTANATMPFVTYARPIDIFGNETTTYANIVADAIPTWAAHASAACNGSIPAPLYERIFRAQHALLFPPNSSCAIPYGELLNSQVAGTLITAFWNLIPFSRGSVHIGSADPTAVPLIDLDYFQVDYDMTVQAKLAEQIRKFWATQPAAGLVTNETVPGTKTVKMGANDTEWAEWLSGEFQPNYHTIGTVAMLPMDLGGVVDENLTVYGTSNVRVVDTSILPFQVSGHLTSTLYAVAERAADIIKGAI